MNSRSKINVQYPPLIKSIVTKETIPVLEKHKSVKEIVNIFENDKVLPIEVEIPPFSSSFSKSGIYDEPINGIAILKEKLLSISRYKINKK